MGIGEGIMHSKETPESSANKYAGGQSSSSPEVRNTLGAGKQTTLDKASSLLDEQTREEKSGFNAKFGVPGMPKNSVEATEEKKSPKTESAYEEDFEEIEEDLPVQDDLVGVGGDIDVSNGSGRAVPKMGESHGITVSQSLGIDPSVDSL